MISLIIPPKDQISRVSKMLADEYGTASNIKSRVNRLSVLGAITSVQQRLKLYTKGMWNYIFISTLVLIYTWIVMTTHSWNLGQFSISKYCHIVPRKFSQNPKRKFHFEFPGKIHSKWTCEVEIQILLNLCYHFVFIIHFLLWAGIYSNEPNFTSFFLRLSGCPCTKVTILVVVLARVN